MADAILAVIGILAVAFVPAIAICKYCEPMSSKERVLVGAFAFIFWPILVLGVIAATIGKRFTKRSTKN